MIAKSADKLTLGELVDYKTLFITFFIMIIIGLITGFSSNYFGGIFSAKILQRFKNTTVKKILRLEYKYFDDKGSGSVITKIISDIAEVQSLFA